MPNVDALLEGMTAAQLAGWAAFAEVEPFGPLREDMRAAQVACAVANRIPFQGQGARPLRPGDLFRSLGEPARRQTAAEMAAFAKARTLAMGGEVLTIPGPQAEPNGRKKQRSRNRHRR